MVKSNYQLSDGLVRQNIVLMSATAIGPVAACATNYDNAVALSVGFTVIAFISVCLCRLVPKKIVYTIRVIIYTLIAGLAFIPAYLAVREFYGQEMIDSLGVYLPVLAVNPLILTKTETRFSLRPFHLMTFELAGYVTGFNLACIGIGIARDVLVNGQIGGFEVSPGFSVPALSTAFGGLIIIGVSAGLFRRLYNQSKERQAKKLEKERIREEMLRELD
jgi:electron transport complex protein RnfE